MKFFSCDVVLRCACGNLAHGVEVCPIDLRAPNVTTAERLAVAAIDARDRARVIRVDAFEVPEAL